jgi:hypothetical protein
MLAIGAGLTTGSAVAAQERSPTSAAQEAAVSADRVAEGLRRPELQIPPIPQEVPTFHTTVTGKLETPLDVIRRELREEAHLHPWQGGHYTAGVDLLPAVMSLVTKIKTIRYEHAEAESRQMVKQELAAFCEEHDCSQAADELPLEGVIVPK